jgi:hypothetical protein
MRTVQKMRLALLTAVILGPIAGCEMNHDVATEGRGLNTYRQERQYRKMLSMGEKGEPIAQVEAR